MTCKSGRTGASNSRIGSALQVFARLREQFSKAQRTFSDGLRPQLTKQPTQRAVGGEILAAPMV